MSKNVISADDPQALEKLKARLEKLEATQKEMRAVNAYYRKNKTLDGCPGLPAEEIDRLKVKMAQPWHREDKPYLSYELSGGNAEIRRNKDRIAQLTRQAEQGYFGWTFDGGEVQIDQEMNRLQIVFDAKPDKELTSELKQGGFHWAPSIGVWQRQLNDNAVWATDYIKAIWPDTGEKPSDFQRRSRAEAASV